MSPAFSASALLMLFALVSCGDNAKPRPENLLTSNDYEELDGWAPDGSLPYLTKEKAHSGVYSARVNSTTEYGGGFTNSLGKLSNTRVTKLRVHGWVWLPSKDANATLVTQLTEPATNKTIFYDGLKLVAASGNKFNQWAEVDKTMVLPANATYATLLKLYLWRDQSAQPVYLDDLQVERAE